MLSAPLQTALIEEIVRQNSTLLFTVPHSTVADHDFAAVEQRATEDGKVAVIELSNFAEVRDLPSSDEPATEHDAAFEEGQDVRFTRIKLLEAAETEPYFVEVQPPSRTEQEARVNPPVAEGDAEPDDEAVAKLEVLRARCAALDEKMVGWDELKLRSWCAIVNNTLEQSVEAVWEQIAQWYPHMVELKAIADAEAAEAAAEKAAEEAAEAAAVEIAAA